MRCYFLDGILDQDRANRALEETFPDQGAYETKVIFSPDGKHPIAYLYVGEPDFGEELDGPFLIQTDVSGRSYDFDIDARIIEVLRALQAKTGGILRDDDAQPI